MSPGDNPLVVLYLLLDEQGRVCPPHPSVRTGSCLRYLECALTQVASLRLNDASCDIALVTNASDRRLDSKSSKLFARIETFGVEILPARPAPDPHLGFLGEALACACRDQPEDRPLWLTNMDCVWVHPERVFAALPASPGIGCLHIPYPVDWHVAGAAGFASCRQAVGEIAEMLGGPGDPTPPWVGADLLAGACSDLLECASVCRQMGEQFAGDGRLVRGEQLLSLAAASGRARLADLSHVAARIHTGRRHDSPPAPEAARLGLWHLPAEKGLSFRRAAGLIVRGRTNGLRRDLRAPGRLAARFNVRPTPLARQIRDDAWLATQRVVTSTRG